MSSLPYTIADWVTTYSKAVIVVALVATLFFGFGAGMVEQQSDTEQFESDSPAASAQEYIQQNFTVEDRENQTTVQVIQRGENVLSREALLESLRLQQQFRETESINRTLVDQGAFFGVENVLATQGYRIAVNNSSATPSLDEQITVMEEIGPEQLDALVTDVLSEGGSPEALALMPSGGPVAYEQGSRSAQARITILTQQTGGGSMQDPEGFGEGITDAQLEIREVANEQSSEYTVFGFGIITNEINQSLGDSFAIVGPLALLFVILALTIAYRDPLDILLGVAGIIAVLVWTFGFMGWTGVAFNQLLISVPVLLIGLSIDYAIHVFMRHREQRGEEGESRDLRNSMSLALGGVGVALVWVTATAAIGFLANLTSPIGPLQDFGVVSAFGVFAALLIFGTLIPAAKIELDGFLEARGFDRQRRAFGTGDSAFSRLLASGAGGARRFPVLIVAVALLLTLGGAYGATQVDTSFNQEDFLAEQPPGWTDHLGPFAPGTYQAKSDLDFIQANFQQEGNEGQLLIRGSVRSDETLHWLDNTTERIGERETTFVLATGEPDVRTPLSAMQANLQPRDEPETWSNFTTLYYQSDETGDGIPDENVTALYGALLETDPTAAEVIHRTEDGTYEALRVSIGLKGDASTGDVATDVRGAAGDLTEHSGGELSVTPTGDQVIFDNVESDLLATVIQGLLITLVAVFLFLAVAYRLTGSPASLGVVTLLPVLLAVTWILGSMWLLDISFNTLTGTITSLTIGLGIAYSIHVSSRYELELRRQGDVWEALDTTVTGTGGALLGSAATTVGGFGTLVFAILPVLQQFGIITGLTIIYAFLASVLVLPSLLVLWTRYLGPSGYFPPHEDGEGTGSQSESR